MLLCWKRQQYTELDYLMNFLDYMIVQKFLHVIIGASDIVDVKLYCMPSVNKF